MSRSRKRGYTPPPPPSPLVANISYRISSTRRSIEGSYSLYLREITSTENLGIQCKTDLVFLSMFTILPIFRKSTVSSIKGYIFNSFKIHKQLRTSTGMTHNHWKHICKYLISSDFIPYGPLKQFESMVFQAGNVRYAVRPKKNKTRSLISEKLRFPTAFRNMLLQKAVTCTSKPYHKVGDPCLEQNYTTWDVSEQKCPS